MPNMDYPQPCMVCGAEGECEHRADHEAFEEAAKSENPKQGKEFEEAAKSDRGHKDDEFKPDSNF
jgi:hypothetical protein